MTTAAPTTSPPDWWEVDSLIVQVGGIVGGNIADTRTDDGNNLTISEASGVYPAGGFKFYPFFKNISTAVTYFRVILKGYYNGTHTIYVGVFNKTTASYDKIITMVPASSEQSYTSIDLDDVTYGYAHGCGLQFIQLSNGIAGELIRIDQLILEDRTAAHSTTAPTTMLTSLAPTTVLTTIAPTTIITTTVAPATLLTTSPPHDTLNDVLFNCKANNYAGVLFVDTYIVGVAASPSYSMSDLELIVDTYITGNVPQSALYELDDLELIVETTITGWAVANDGKKNWIGWSKIGEADFTVDEVNDAGFRTLEWAGYVYQVLKLDKNVVIYGSGGVTMAFPVSQPMATFGFKELLNIGVKNKTAVTGDSFIHFFIDVLGCLYKLSGEGLEKLGYEEFLLPLTNPVLTWDNDNRMLYISDSSIGYVLNDGSLTGGYANITGLYRIKDVLEGVSPDTISTEPVEVVTDVIDFKRRGLKSIESMQFNVDSDVKLYAAIDYKYDKGKGFSTTEWTPLNDSGVAHVRAAGYEFRIRVKGAKWGSFSLSEISVQYKFIDQRFTRDPNYRRSDLNDY